MKKQKKKEPINITDGLAFACPWCSERCTVSNEHGCVVHPVPTCRGFDTHDVVEIVAAANRKAAILEAANSVIKRSRS